MNSKRNSKQPSLLQRLRSELSKLRTERDSVIMEKGLIAQDNKDLRENGAYIALEQKEHLLSSRIHDLMREIYELAKR